MGVEYIYHKIFFSGKDSLTNSKLFPNGYHHHNTGLTQNVGVGWVVVIVHVQNEMRASFRGRWLCAGHHRAQLEQSTAQGSVEVLETKHLLLIV